MEICLLGNGFDLMYNFPTNYQCFLHTMDYLVKNPNCEAKTIGDIFGNLDLQNSDELINKSYTYYAKVYHGIILPEHIIKALRNIATNNIWLLYLRSIFNRDIGWIDFEKEIGTVLAAFSELFSCYSSSTLQNKGQYFRISSLSESNQEIILRFPFFFKKHEGGLMPNIYVLFPQYTLETLKNSGIFTINKTEIISHLWNEMIALSNLLKDYLHYFVDNATKKLLEDGLLIPNPICSNAKYVITLNYTHTYEHLYNNTAKIAHVHGSISNEIVMGINSNSTDELESIDTSFLYFKKYCQRIWYNSDHAYLSIIDTLRDIKARNVSQKEKFTLQIIGHSLDITDKEIIEELFNVCDEVIIRYHNALVIGTYIKNLVNIFGKKRFDELRYQKKLKFLSTTEVYSDKNAVATEAILA